MLGAGHTDGLGGDDDDQDLSERRAAAVASVLADLAGAGPSFEQAGYGTTRPLLPEVTPAGEDAPSARARDRRVDITLVDGVSWPTVVPDGDVVRETSALRS